MASHPRNWTKRAWIARKDALVEFMQKMAADNYTIREIAEEVGLCKSTVHKYLSEAKRKNQQAIERIQAALK